MMRTSQNKTVRALMASSRRLLKRQGVEVSHVGEIVRPSCAHGCGFMGPRELMRGCGVTLAVWSCRCGQTASRQIADVER